jgi:hypothetical protein
MRSYVIVLFVGHKMDDQVVSGQIVWACGSKGREEKSMHVVDG